MSYTYATYTQAISTYSNIPLTDAAFAEAMATIINQAEMRIYTDLQLLSAIVVDSSALTTPGSRNFTLPQPGGGLFVVLQSVNILNGDTRSPVIQCGRELLDFLWPSNTGNGDIPNKWAPVTDQIILFGPAPISNYNVECIGNIRPAALSASNTTTWMSTQIPALFFAAGMIAATGYMRDYGQQSDDPKFATSWQDQYDRILPDYQKEETLRKFGGYYGGK